MAVHNSSARRRPYEFSLANVAPTQRVYSFSLCPSSRAPGADKFVALRHRLSYVSNPLRRILIVASARFRGTAFSLEFAALQAAISRRADSLSLSILSHPPPLGQGSSERERRREGKKLKEIRARGREGIFAIKRNLFIDRAVVETLALRNQRCKAFADEAESQGN